MRMRRSDGIACVSGSVQPPGVVRSKSWSISARWGELQQEMRPLMVAASVPRILIQLQARLRLPWSSRIFGELVRYIRKPAGGMRRARCVDWLTLSSAPLLWRAT